LKTCAILDKIRAADNLPSLPAVALQVLKMTQSEDVSIAEIARVIQQDPALTARLLKTVNSSLFGMSRKISSLPQAMVVLGLRTVKVIVLSFSLVDTMRGYRTGGFDFAMYWRRSLTTAVAGRLLAERVSRRMADEAFVTGLLCDLGILAASHCAKELYGPVLEKYDADEEPLQAVELSLLGVTHEAMGRELLNHWGLPETICNAIQSHHAAVGDFASANEAEAASIRILRSAATIADLFCAEVHAGHLGDCKKQIMDGLGIEEAVLDEVLEALDSHVKETATMFALNIGPTISYQAIQGEASVQLVRLTMAAELERAQIAQREQLNNQKIEELNDEKNKLAQQAMTDALTGVGNRAAFDQRLADECERADRCAHTLGLLMLDLDRFKKLNDTFGHQTGDEALRQVGECINKIADETKFPARYGGEEFALVVVNATVSQLRDLAEEIRTRIQQLRIPHGQQNISITASIGVAHVQPSNGGVQPRELVERADRCLYDAKHGGRNRVVVDEGNGA